MRTVEIPVPYDQGDMALELTLDSSSKGKTADWAMGWIVDNVPWESKELETIMRSAVILFHNEAGAFGECLDTAIIWSRG